MSSEDYVDCVDKLLHLGLKGRQEQEIQRVLVDCALQQRIYNPYFALVARRLAEGDGNHRLTLQFAIWDKLKVGLRRRKRSEGEDRCKGLNVIEPLVWLLPSSSYAFFLWFPIRCELT